VTAVRSLEANGLEMEFGAVKALAGIDVSIHEGHFIGIIGANGSGKTTFFNCVTGFLRPTGGKVIWADQDITGWPAHRVARLGIVRTFQHPAYFSSGTVSQNLEMAIAVAGSSDDRARLKERVVDLLNEVGLASAANRPAGLLPYGSLRQLGVAIALAARPRLLLLDEPAAGLNDAEADAFGRLLKTIHERGVGLCVVDHDMEFLLPLVDQLVVLDAGKLLARGPVREVQRDPAVIRAYLGSRFGQDRTAGVASAEPSEDDRAGPPLLSIRDLRVDYGQVQAVKGIDLELQVGEAVALLGPNGAGKTSVLRAVSHHLPYRGTVELDGRRLSGRADQVARLGVSHVLEGRHIFGQLTVAENLRVPRYARRGPSYSDDLVQVLEMFPLLKPRLKALGGQLSGGQQQALAIARALLMRPRLLLLDEPSLGLAPVVVEQLAASAAQLRRWWKVSVLIAEQSLTLVMEVAERYYLMRRGEIVRSGRFGMADEGEEILRAYLGDHEAEATSPLGNLIAGPKRQADAR
jgi:branched-chain amino acid transport system ATP-binding protein